MARVYVSGPMSTRSFTVDETDGIGLGLAVAFNSRDTTETVKVADANNSTIGVAYAGDFTAKYASITTIGSGIGTAKTQNTVADGDRITVLLKGAGTVVECYTSAANLSAGSLVGSAAGGSVVAIDNDSGMLALGTTITAQATQSSTVEVLMH